MATLKHSSTAVKDGKSKAVNRQKGLAYYRSLLTLSEHDGNKKLANICRAIIKCLEEKDKDEKAK